LPATPELRRKQIKLQVALIGPLIHVKGYAAPESKAAAKSMMRGAASMRRRRQWKPPKNLV
jgi:hypothetical protein